MPSEFFQVGITYEVVTHESAERGDFDEIGWTQEYEAATLRDALATLKRYEPFDGIQVQGNSVDPYDTLSAPQADGDIDFQTGAVTRETVFVRGSWRNVERLLALYMKGAR